jgi:hypothetical protein
MGEGECMNTTFKVTKYQLNNAYKGIVVFYVIIFTVALATVVMSNKIGGKVTFGGLGIATVIFLIIAGLDWFKTNFKFLMANNVSRKEFYKGSIAAMATVAAFMALVDTIVSIILSRAIPYESMFMQLYGKSNKPAEFFWSFGLYTFVVCLGWLIAIVYYRANGAMKVVVFASPFIIVTLFGQIDRLAGGAMGLALMAFVNKAMGFAYNNNSYIAVLIFLIAAAVLLMLGLMGVRRAPVKD